MNGRIIAAGGGSAADSLPLDRRFAGWLPEGGRLLYLPIAMDGGGVSYAQCLDWITGVFRPLGLTAIEMVTGISAGNLPDLTGFAAVYIGGGNTWRLLHLLRTSGLDRRLVNFWRQGGLIYGGSAGAIILGADISTCADMDSNEVGLDDPVGLDLLRGFAVWCHYQVADAPRVQSWVQEMNIPVIALSERSGLVLEQEGLAAGGFEPAWLFDGETLQKLLPGADGI